MDRPYKNVVTNDIVSFDKYIIFAEYETKEEAMENLKTDVNAWTEKHKHEARRI